VLAPHVSYSHSARPGTTYTYAVRAVTGDVVSPFSAPVLGKAASRAPGVVARLNHYTVKRRTAVTFSGRVNAHYGGERVYRQYWTGRSWRTIASVATRSDGSYQFTIRPGSTSRTTYRLVLAGSATHMAGISRSLRLTVR
jgi:hypothetical protein